jgi:hypothetical protein
MATGKYILIELDFTVKLTLEQEHKIQVSKYSFLNKGTSFLKEERKTVILLLLLLQHIFHLDKSIY